MSQHEDQIATAGSAVRREAAVRPYSMAKLTLECIVNYQELLEVMAHCS